MRPCFAGWREDCEAGRLPPRPQRQPTYKCSLLDEGPHVVAILDSAGLTNAAAWLRGVVDNASPEPTTEEREP